MDQTHSQLDSQLDSQVALFAAEYPQQWRRTELIAGLRGRIVSQLDSCRAQDYARQRRSLGYLLGYGRDMSDEQWSAWAAAAFSWAVDATADNTDACDDAAK
jgi:hypothetical protein